jgi:hypothetical protein
VLAAEPDPQPVPGPAEPLQTPPETTEDAFLHQGWTANILGIGGGGKTSLVVEGEEGYQATITVGGTPTTKTNPAVFELGDEDHRIDLKVKDSHGAVWAETVDVPKGMKVTVKIKSRYEHRGFEGTIKNDTQGCRGSARRHLRFEIYQSGNQVGAAINLDPGKSAHGVRLKPGIYDLKIFERAGADHRLVKTTTIEPKAAQWRHDEGCK